VCVLLPELILIVDYTNHSSLLFPTSSIPIYANTPSQLYNIKKNSLHALLTNIKWDFNNTNQLAGEVSIPNKAIHQRFCLDKNELSEFDISNKLWKMIEG